MFTVSFNMFNDKVSMLRKVFGKGFFNDVSGSDAYKVGYDQLCDQFNVKKMYVLVYQYDNGVPEDSNSENIGYFLSKEHAVRAGEEYAKANNYRFVADDGDLQYSDVEIFVREAELHG